MPSVLEVDVPTPPSSAGAAQVSQSWLPKAGSTLQPDPMYRQKRLALEDDAPSENAQLNTTAPGRLKASTSASAPPIHPLQALLKKYFGGEKTTMKELGAMFKTIDTSGDGFVSFDEMVAAARKASPPQSAAAVSSADEIDDDDFATS